LSNTSQASADFVVANNGANASIYYGDFGINSGAFTGSGSYNLPNAVYVYSQSSDLVLGTSSNNSIHFYTNNSTTDVLTMYANATVSASTLVTSPEFLATNGIYINNKAISANVTIATGQSAMSTGPVTLANGVVVTVATGSKWVVL
jgi:hypothetical protein